LTALEVLARLACDTGQDAFVRRLAMSILVKDEFALRLWTASDVYRPLVYDLLLALDRRIYVYYLSPNASEWRITN
jgi:hypothetical protein